MSQLALPLVDPDTAPDGVRATLAAVRTKYGFLPNLYRFFAHAPPVLDAYLALSECYGRTSFTATERNLVQLVVSRENGCLYCVAVHSTVGDMQKDDPAVIDAIRDGTPIADAKLQALRQLTEALVRGRGHAEPEIAAFVQAGYTQTQVLEILIGIAQKTLSNYTNHLVSTPLDPVFAARKWTPESR